MSQALDWSYHEPYAYLDSGEPVGGSDCTTWIIIHGLTWHAPVFRRLLPLANLQNIRIIAINRRDYPGALPLKAEDVLPLTLPEGPEALDGFRSFMKDRALEFLKFMDWMVDDGIIKSPSEKNGRKSGGVSIIGWSGGNRILLSLLGNLSRYPSELTRKLGRYIQSLIIYECPGHSILGFAPHSKRYIPLSDDSIPPEERMSVFAQWTSGYYYHPALSSTLPLDPKQANPADLDIEFRNILTFPPASIVGMTPDEISENVEQSVADENRAEGLAIRRALNVGYAKFERRHAFFEEDNLNIWNATRTILVYGDMTMGEIVYGALALEAEIAEAKSKGERARNVEFVKMSGGNHYAHWDDPRRTFDLFVDCISG